MVKRAEAGFSLIELIVVMAISSLLMVGLFAGQRGLRSRAQFDAAVDRVVASVNDAHTQATAGVNVTGAGDGLGHCSGGAGTTVFAGVAWTADDSLSPSPLKMDYYKADSSGACSFQTQALSLPSQIQVNHTANPASKRGGRVLFVRDSQGGLVVCSVNNLNTGAINPAASFAAGGCTGGASTATLTLTFTDTDNHSSQVSIDQSGLAKRLN